MSLRKLPPGSEFQLALRPADKGQIIVRPQIGIGEGSRKRITPMGQAKRVRTEVEAWIEVEKLAQDRLAQLGRMQMKTMAKV